MNDRGKIADVEQLIEDFQQSGMRELHVRAEGFELFLSTDPEATGIDVVQVGTAVAIAPVSMPAAAPAVVTAAVGDDVTAPADVSYPEGATIVRAPYLGTFYRAPKPGAPTYVEIGSEVTPDTELCLVEVMKLFTAVRAGVGGRVHQVLATDGQMVQADQPLFVVVAD